MFSEAQICTQITGLCVSVVNSSTCFTGLMALAINISTEHKNLTQTPLLKIWVPWSGGNLNRRRGCKFIKSLSHFEYEITVHYLPWCLFCLCFNLFLAPPKAFISIKTSSSHKSVLHSNLSLLLILNWAQAFQGRRVERQQCESDIDIDTAMGLQPA